MALRPLIAGQFYDKSPASTPVTPGGADGSIQYNNAGAFGGVTGLTTVAGVLSGVAIVAPANAVAEAISGYSITGSGATSMLSYAGTLNTTGKPQLLSMDIINTASAVDSFGDGTNFFRFRAGAAGTTYQAALGIDGRFFARLGFFVLPGIGGNRSACVTDSGGAGQFFLNASGTFIWSSGADAGSGGDAAWTRPGAGIIAQSSGAQAQAYRIFGNTTGSHYLNLTHNGTNALINVNGGGTLLISSLPTANPGPGILWNNAGTPAIGT